MVCVCVSVFTVSLKITEDVYTSLPGKKRVKQATIAIYWTQDIMYSETSICSYSNCPVSILDLDHIRGSCSSKCL